MNAALTSARAWVVLASVLGLLGCSEPYAPPSGSLVLETADGEPAQAIALLRARVGDVEEATLLTDPLLDRRGVASLRFPLALTADEWGALIDGGETLAPAATVQYRLAREDGAIVRRPLASLTARWIGPGELRFEGELGPASPRPDDDPPPELDEVAGSIAFETRWDVVVHCQVVEGEAVYDDTGLESPECRALLTRAGFARCLEPGTCD